MSPPTSPAEPDPPRRLRWTLGSMMIAIALIALLLGLAGLFVRFGAERERVLRMTVEAERRRAEAEAYRAQVMLAQQAAAAQAQTTTAADDLVEPLKAENEKLRAEVEALRREVERLRKAAEPPGSP